MRDLLLKTLKNHAARLKIARRDFSKIARRDFLKIRDAIILICENRHGYYVDDIMQLIIPLLVIKKRIHGKLAFAITHAGLILVSYQNPEARTIDVFWSTDDGGELQCSVNGLAHAKNQHVFSSLLWRLQLESARSWVEVSPLKALQYFWIDKGCSIRNTTSETYSAWDLFLEWPS